MHKEAQTRYSHLGIYLQKCYWASLCLLVALLSTSSLTNAKTIQDGINRYPDTENKLSIRIITPKNTKKGILIEDALKKHPNLTITRSSTDNFLALEKNKQIIITVGAVAFHQVLKSHLPHTLILATYISKNTYFKVLEVYKEETPSVTAIFSEIPLGKQIRLAKTLLPQSTHLTTLISEQSQHHKNTIIESARANNIEANVHVFENRSSLNKLFESGVFKPTFILSHADPLIFNARSLKHIILKGYRNNISVIGPNNEAVSGGSLASIYFPDKEMLRVSKKVILYFRDTGIAPSPQNLNLFNFVINKNVAKSMNINIPPDRVINRALGMDWLEKHEK